MNKTFRVGGETLQLFLKGNDKMEKINLQRNEEEFYRIEVNDNGDYIEFDLTDIELPERILKASKEIIKIDEEYRNKSKEIFGIIKKDNIEAIEKSINFEKEYCKKMREIYDSFLGENACQKIFGNKNNYGQFDLLMEQLEPHFSKMNYKLNLAKKKLAQKYMNKNEEVI